MVDSSNYALNKLQLYINLEKHNEYKRMCCEETLHNEHKSIFKYPPTTNYRLNRPKKEDLKLKIRTTIKNFLSYALLLGKPNHQVLVKR